MEERGDGMAKEVRVEWSTGGEPQWIKLQDNPELRMFLQQNEFNPHVTSLNSIKYTASSDVPIELQALKQVVFDALGQGRHTADGRRGYQKRVCVRIPFPAPAFQQIFGQLEELEGSEENGNVKVRIQADKLDAIMGEWRRRRFATSTETFIPSGDQIYITWGYRARHQYTHAACRRYKVSFTNVCWGWVFSLIL